jgi:hypothetical protein
MGGWSLQSQHSDYRAIDAASFDEISLNGCAPIPSAGAGMVRHCHTNVALCEDHVAPMPRRMILLRPDPIGGALFPQPLHNNA